MLLLLIIVESKNLNFHFLVLHCFFLALNLQFVSMHFNTLFKDFSLKKSSFLTIIVQSIIKY